MPYAPLIVTLLVDDDAQQHFDALRSEHFPAERNYLRAHVTLFHALPGGRGSTCTSPECACSGEASHSTWRHPS